MCASVNWCCYHMLMCLKAHVTGGNGLVDNSFQIIYYFVYTAPMQIYVSPRLRITLHVSRSGSPVTFLLVSGSLQGMLAQQYNITRNKLIQ